MVAELEFELEGYFQRRISNDFTDSLHVPSHRNVAKNQGKKFSSPKLDHNLTVGRIRNI